MDQAQPAQRAFSQGIIAQVWNDQPSLVADNDVFHHAGAVDQDTDLTTNVS